MSFRRGLLLVALSILSLQIAEAQATGLLQVFGNGQAVKAGTSFGLGVRAVGPGQVPRAGVRVFVTSIVAFGPTISCAEAVTGADGLASVICAVGAWPFSTGMIITVGDELGRLAAPFNIQVNPLTLADGLTKFQGDLIRVVENDTFDLGVQANLNGGPQEGLLLDVIVDPSNGPVECPLTAVTDATGQANIRCQTKDVPFQTKVEITIRDPLDRFVTFVVTVITAESLTDGIFKFSGDNQAVPAGGSFPLDLVAQVITNDTAPDPSLWGAPVHSGVTDTDPVTPGIQFVDAGAVAAGNPLFYLVTAFNGCAESHLTGD